jgi:hypothetical protein
LSSRSERPFPPVVICVGCRVIREADDEGWRKLKAGWKCSACRVLGATERRKGAGQRILANAKTSTIERDGRTFIVHTLPPKRK